jgi:hypothetical protein
MVKELVVFVIRKICRILKEIVYTLVSLVSRIINAVFLRGSMHQTTSARAHVMSVVYGDPFWMRIRKFINRLFFWEVDHCALAWEFEYDRASRTIQLGEKVNVNNATTKYNISV